MKHTWWKEAVAYQIYPRSFKDSNNDGIGDLPGITSKLDYLKDLGIGVIWISPFFKSPNDDNGYDISDYQEISSDYGTMKDFDVLLEEAHKRDIKIIIDLVINHTSDEHPWFIESRSSKDSDKRDWYIWRDGKEGREPNNWESIFKGSAWECDEVSDQYYLHLFSKKQPDLNWENPVVRKELYKMVNWWLDKGIDGFRVDAISHIKKEDGLIDMPNPNNEKYVSSFDKHMNVDGIMEYLTELKDNTFSNYDIMTVGEANGVNSDDAASWVGEEDGIFNMVFQFEHLDLWDSANNKFVAKECQDIFSKWQDALNNVGWNALYIENHDITRVVSTWGNDQEYREVCAKAFALMYFMHQGTPFIYQGQEIGMTNIVCEDINEYDDIKTVNSYYDLINKGMDANEALTTVASFSRDNVRTPMQWSNQQYGGFSEVKPWLPVNPNYHEINVESQLNDPNSILNFYKNLIKVRKENKTLIYGDYQRIDFDENIYAYKRRLDDEEFLIVCNLSDQEINIDLKPYLTPSAELLIYNYENQEDNTFNAYECRMYKL